MKLPQLRGHKTWDDFEYGALLRNKIDTIARILYPYVSRILPNFKSIHYFYILTWCILGSILMYPVRNHPYIDILFFACGASTQSGLNTVDVNKLKLYQQILIYVITTFTTPIFIHGSLLFVRLYSFERYFDNIKETSKMNNQMRRNATLASMRSQSLRTQSFDATRLNTATNQGLGMNIPLEEIDTTANNSVEHVSEPSEDSEDVVADSETETESESESDTETDSDLKTNSKHNSKKNPSPPPNSNIEKRTPYQKAQSPSDLYEGPLHPSNSSSVAKDSLSSQSKPSPDEGIKFGSLPSPKRRDHEVNPSDMYWSIDMLQKSKPNNEDDDDVLIIKSPNEIENADESNPIFTKRNNIQFVDSLKSRPRRLSRRVSHKVPFVKKTKRGLSLGSLMNEENENDSINSDNESLSSNDSDDGQPPQSIDEEDTNDNNIRKARSYNIASGSQKGNKKHNKRSNTLDIGSKNRIPNSPTTESRPRLRQLTSRLSRSITGRSLDEESTISHELSRQRTTNYLSWEPTIGRNSNFVHLTEEQKEELGGVEYRSTKLLIKIVVGYYIGFHILALLVYIGWILDRENYQTIIRDYGVSPLWWGFFTGQTSFNDLGYTLTPNSMIEFNRSPYVMIWGFSFIVLGNTGFPVALRFIIWIMYKFSRPLSLYQESLSFLLDHPRRCFTLLFPSGPTWWLFAILVILNGVDLIFFIILDLNNNYLQKIPVGYRILCGLYNAFSTRTAGLSVIDLSQLHAAVQVSYMIMMYISVLPIAISIRRTNVYEEQSLGIYMKDSKEGNEKSPSNFIGNHLRNQLSFDLWFVFLGLFFICIAENSQLEKDNFRFNVFTVLFEVVSAYGTVGLSLGFPTVNTSLCGKFSTISKLIIIAMMIRGRHRGLPYSLDRAIILPSDKMLKKDEVQEGHALQRHDTINLSNSMNTGTDSLFQTLTQRGNDILRRRTNTGALQ